MVEISNRTGRRLDRAMLERAASEFIRRFAGGRGTVSIAVVEDDCMRRLYRKHFGRRGRTDVIAFPAGRPAPGGGDYLGEVIVNLDQVRRQAVNFSPSVKDELVFVLVHGLLHLMGHEDDTERKKARMLEAGEEFIRGLKAGPVNKKANDKDKAAD